MTLDLQEDFVFAVGQLDSEVNQVCKLMTRPTTDQDSNTKATNWYGMVRNGRRTFALNYDWVLAYFKRGFIYQCLQDEGKWHEVHPGASATVEQIQHSPNAQYGVHYGYDTHPD